MRLRVFKPLAQFADAGLILFLLGGQGAGFRRAAPLGLPLRQLLGEQRVALFRRGQLLFQFLELFVRPSQLADEFRVGAGRLGRAGCARRAGL